ncbi:MAG: TonB-dependent receptor, partial [Mangrovibacterium sp.]
MKKKQLLIVSRLIAFWKSKLFLTMRLTLLAILLAVFQGFALNTYAQNTKLTLKMENTTIKKVLNSIEEQTDFFFLYNSKLIDVEQKVTIDIQGQNIKNVLEQVFTGTGINYEILDRQILLSSRNVNMQQPAQLSVKGQVTDSQGAPLPGVTVVVKGTTKGTITDADGNYSLMNVPNDAILVFSFVGMRSQEIPVAGKQNINVAMEEETIGLEEVVAIGYGTVKKANLTGSVANVNAEKLNTQSNTTIGQALQGKIAGVDIVSQGGLPGSSVRVMIRGIGTLNESAPLYVVDGMYMDGIDHINPNDIATIDVLKDASSAAIYGSRAANGVVIITTKKGSFTDGKPIIDFSVNAGVSAPSKYLDLLDAKGWAEVTTVAREAVGYGALEMATDLDSKEDNDWQDIIMDPALVQNYNLSIKGAGKYSTYYNSIGYTNQDGVMKGTHYERYTFQSKLDFHRGIFEAGTNVVGSYDQSNPLLSDIRGGQVGHALLAIPTLSKYDENNAGGYGASYGDVVNLFHPLGMVDDNLMSRHSDHAKIYVNAYLSLEFIKGLKYKLNFTPDFQFYRYNEYQGIYDFGLNTNDITSVEETQTRTRNMLVENLLSFDRTFGSHKISALGGYTYQNSKYRYLWGEGQEMAEGIKEIDGAASGLAVSGNSSRSVLTSILARVFYSYKDRYLVSASIRRDGSSRFGSSHRHGNFPSVSVGWNIAEERFMKKFSWLDQLKLRGGYGVLGNQEIDDYQYSSVVTTGINYPDGEGGVLQGAFPKNFANSDIKWEETAMTNIGVDFMALNNRLSLTADGYVKNTKGILLEVPVPISTGAANDPIRNAGKIRNKGVEFNVGWNDRVNEDFSYNVNFIGTFNRNKVVKMGEESQTITSGTIHGGTYTCKTLAGYPIAGFWLIETDGYFNSEAEVQAYSKDGTLIQPSAEPGDIRFKDTNDDGTIDDNDRVYCGSPFPKFTYSLNGSINYKNFDFSLNFQGVSGNKIYNATRLELEDVTRGTNYL